MICGLLLVGLAFGAQEPQGAAPVADPAQRQSPGGSYSCGPFLLQPGPHAMTVVVDHRVPVSAVMEWGPVGGKRIKVEHAQAHRHHIFALTGLQPNQEYSYRIWTADRLTSGERSFRTLPLAPSSYRVVVVGDVRSQPAVWQRVSRQILADERDALFMIGTGDYPADGRMYPLWILQFFRPAQDLLARMPMWPAIGNHEATRPASSLLPEASKYFSLFELPGNEHWYRVDYHLMTLLVLDSNSHCAPGSEQYEWLRTELRKNRARFTVVAFHHAPFTSGLHGARWLDGTPREWPLDEAQRFLVPLFEMYLVDLVLNGHDHLYERSEKDGIVYLVTGGGGAPLYPVNDTHNRYQMAARSEHHYVTLDVHAEQIVARAIAVGGEVIDTVAIKADASWLQRRHALLAQVLANDTVFGPLQEQALTLPYELRNSLDHELKVSMSRPAGQTQVEIAASFAMPPKATHSGSIDLSFMRAAFARDPWAGDLVVPITMQFEGRDAVLAVRFPLRREVVVRRKHYPVALASAPKLDGNLSDWHDVPAMAVGAGSGLVRGALAYRGEQDCGAQVRMVASATHLFVAVQVTDDDVQDGDGMHLLFAPESAVLARSTAGAVVAHSAWSSGRFVSTDATGQRAAESKGKVLKRSGGYIVEMSIPLGELPLPASGRVGFDIQVDDRDQGEAGTILRLWSDHERAIDVSQFGFLYLAK